MRDRQRNAPIAVCSVIVAVILTTFIVACMATSQPIPVPAPGTPLFGISAPTPIATEGTPVPEPAADTPSSGPLAAGPAAIPHKFEGREECTDCHEVGGGRDAAPPDHVGFSDEFCLYCHTPEESAVAVPALPDKASAEFCLGCHSPYEELQARTADVLLDEDGVKANPHAYVPHDNTTITECRYCHDVHALPVIPSEEMAKPDATYCFAACHHEENYESCTNCH